MFTFVVIIIAITVYIEFHSNGSLLTNITDKINKLIISFLPNKEVPNILDFQTKVDTFALSIEEVNLFRDFLTKLSDEEKNETETDIVPDNSMMNVVT